MIVYRSSNQEPRLSLKNRFSAEGIKTMAEYSKEFANELLAIACKQYKTCYDFKKDRIDDIRKNKEFYIGRKVKAPRGRFGISLPTMAGFVDQLESKIDDAPSVKFGYGSDIADLPLSQKITSAWEIDSHPTKANWALVDRWVKKLAIFSGRGIYKIYSESDPKYRNCLEAIDFEDFIFEPMGGGDLRKHLFCGQDNIFRTLFELEEGAKSGYYDVDQIALLKNNSLDDTKKNEDIYKSRANELKQLGLNLAGNDYVGQKIVKLTEMYLEYKGQKWYILFDYITNVWIKCVLLTEVFESNLWPYESWATHEDPFNFSSKAPCDDMRGIADGMDILFNQALENRYKRNFGMRGIDQSIFPNPEELEWRPDGFALSKASAHGKNMRDGIYEFQTPEIAGTIDLVTWMDNFASRKTGINPQDIGAEDVKDQKVGIYFGNLQQMADRVGLTNKSYREAHLGLGLKYAWGLKEHLIEPMMVKMIGENGVEWGELTRGEAQKSPDLDLEISGGSAEVMANEAKSRKREMSLDRILKSPNLSPRVNQNWLLGEILKGGYEEADIRLAMSKDAGNLEMLSKASQAIQDILNGKKPKLVRGATTVFTQKILDFATDHDELPLNQYKALIQYIMAHEQIVIENTVRGARAMVAQNRLAQGPNTQNISENLQVPEGQAGAPTTPGVSGNQASAYLTGKSQPSIV